ncbi:MGMT family protein [Myxococcota bacterium]|nr:MGMT family protein [Myxococcota bacterium]
MSGWERVHRVVPRIPAGRVASYGQVAQIAGMPRAARQVGYALHALEAESSVPWHRVVNAAGRISARGGLAPIELLQRARLEAEGVQFDGSGRIDLERFGWKPRTRPAVTSMTNTKSKTSSKRSRGNKP